MITLFEFPTAQQYVQLENPETNQGKRYPISGITSPTEEHLIRRIENIMSALCWNSVNIYIDGRYIGGTEV